MNLHLNANHCQYGFGFPPHGGPLVGVCTLSSGTGGEVGDAEAGDPRPYLPEHQIIGLVGFEQGPPRHLAVGQLHRLDCTTATCGEFERTDAATLVDLSLHYDFSDRLRVYVTGHQPRGARPNLDTTGLVGLCYRL